MVRPTPERCVENHVDLAVLHHVDHVGTALEDLVDDVARDPVSSEMIARALRGPELESQFGELPGDRQQVLAVVLVDRQECRPSNVCRTRSCCSHRAVEVDRLEEVAGGSGRIGMIN